MALNAAVFGFAGHSIVTPHQAIQNIWWTDERIEAKVTREFVVSKLRPSERDQLFRPMFMGSGLTEDTYLDWVLTRAKRLFLILVECGCSDQIFGIAEDSWDDDDLPIALSEIPRLALSSKDDTLNMRFYHTQFRFLLRPLDFHGHIDYAPNEVVPIEYVHKIAPAAALQKWSRFHLPKMPTLIYAKRKVILGEKDEIDEELKERFLEDVQIMRTVEHEHIAPVLATWCHKNAAYIMTSFVGEHTLRSFIDFRTPASMQKVSKQERQTILLEWIHCLSHALAYLHRKRIVHTAICPSNLIVDENNNIAFADLGFLDTFQKDKRFEADELFNYGSPEQFTSTTRFDRGTIRAPIPTKRFFHKRRKSDQSNSGSDSSSEATSALSMDSKGNYIVKSRSNSQATITPITTRDSGPPRLNSQDFSVSPTLDLPFDQMSLTSSKSTAPSSMSGDPKSSNNELDQKASDVYSLACVFLDIISFMLKRKPNEFFKYRATKVKNPGGKGTHMDASFHNNPQKVQAWMEILENDLPIKQDRTLFALPPLFRLIKEMLNSEAQRRPPAAEVQSRVFDALYNYGGLQNLHCNNYDQRPASTLSLTRTSTSGGSSRSSEPRLASYPEIASLLPPALPPKSPRRPQTSSSTSSSRYVETKAGTNTPNVPPIPPLPTRNASLTEMRRLAYLREKGVSM
ncbi:uncharacterized protein PV09_00598 [Verruconis gallopava]|uniref:Protein kinase domain-containing protein n=1 Tax=Verruconis gallopava TaxID=253628 RepID=A0A0D1Z6Q2_9PEZI|nr:uncharacterized protein PV09_00598 [Verruconis gallopava]KIW08642.1 hypothetical protein PV09_00598 [Verruconis gallopava]